MISKFAIVLSILTISAVIASDARAEKTPLTKTLTSVGFRHIATKDGVTVYKHPRSPIVRLAAEGKLNQPPDRVLRALIDYSRQPKFLPRVSEAQILHRGSHWLVVYQRLNLPVISDRDFTLFVRTGQQGNTSWLTYRAVTNRGPEARSGVIRITLHRGSWQLRPADGGRSTFARFQVVIDLSGSLPKWMAKSGAGKEVPLLFANIAALAATYAP